MITLILIVLLAGDPKPHGLLVGLPPSADLHDCEGAAQALEAKAALEPTVIAAGHQCVSVPVATVSHP